ncbi:hypothetical protein AWZ03_014326 [Drosophila navojoa]|uniref:Ubiquitin-like protease family profile domain-containing protein n=1 Tax=Drosophila navojoa TaxID=7232 RepID=A0A484AT66_DRONA|nr:hypothetical protein AWZ03_014326 [Drosophila navojoa]
MPRNVRQKKRAERRVQAAAAAAVDEVANDNKKLINGELDEQAMGDGHGNEVSTNASCNANGNGDGNASGKDQNANGNANGNGSGSNNNNSNNNNNNSLCPASSSNNTNLMHTKKPKTSRADPILASLSKNALRMSDVQLLHGPHWLNDAILNFYFAYLEEIKYKSNSDFLFVTPEMSQCMLYMDDKELHGLLVSQHQVLRKPFLFMAVNDSESRDRGGAHWSLVVASRPDKSFFHFDSYGGGNTSSSMELVNNIKDVLEMQHARFRGMRCLQQSNDYDCGIHVICMADQITDYVNRFDSVDGVQPLHQDVIKAKRNQLIKLVASLGQHI